MNFDFAKKLAHPCRIAIFAFFCSCGPSLPPVVETISPSNGYRERRYVLEGKPIFTTSGQKVTINIQTKHAYKLWPLEWPEKLLPHRKLEGLSDLRFELLEESIMQDRNFWPSSTPVIRRVWNRDQLVLDTTPRCEVHHLLMKRQVEDGQEGDQSKRFFRRQRRLFPNDGKFYQFCSSGLMHFVWACPECERIQKKEYSDQPWLDR